MSFARRNQWLLLLACCGWAWLLMQAVHELGHIAAAGMTGGKVTRVVLHPLAISRTDVEPNPRPLSVVWAGPMVGALTPLLAWLVAPKGRLRAYLGFFAGFCLLANGLYLGLGGIEQIGDAGDILRHGGQIWHLILFAAATIPLGFWVWHSHSADFGFGPAPLPISTLEVAIAWGVWAAIFALLFATATFPS